MKNRLLYLKTGFVPCSKLFSYRLRKQIILCKIWQKSLFVLRQSLESLRLPWLRFFRDFSSVVRQMPGYNSQRLGTANTLPNLLFVLFFVIRVVLLSIMMFYVLFMCKCTLPPGVNPTAVDKYISINIKHVTHKYGVMYNCCMLNPLVHQ
jgi:hypothetical protein